MNPRYRNGKRHNIFVLIYSGRDSITEYYCTCEIGARTVGSYSYVITTVWFLGHCQYHGIQIPNPDICDSFITISENQNKSQ